MFPIDWLVSLAGFFVGGIVGLTGMGGGALMTPVLVLLFGIPPTVAVASDLAASLFMKPVGALVHLKRGTINGALVRLLCLGSIPAAFAGAALANHLGKSQELENGMRTLLGAALLVAASGTVAKSVLSGQRSVPAGRSLVPIEMKPVRTVLVGLVGGFIVGMTSVGSGSLVIVMLMLVYPQLTGSRLVGTDLAQAIPLVGAAALAHTFFGGTHLGLTASLLVGGIPGVFLGALASSSAPDRLIRPVLVLALATSALKLLGVPNAWIAAVAASVALGGLAWATRRGTDLLPSLPDPEADIAAAGDAAQ